MWLSMYVQICSPLYNTQLHYTYVVSCIILAPSTPIVDVTRCSRSENAVVLALCPPSNVHEVVDQYEVHFCSEEQKNIELEVSKGKLVGNLFVKDPNVVPGFRIGSLQSRLGYRATATFSFPKKQRKGTNSPSFIGTSHLQRQVTYTADAVKRWLKQYSISIFILFKKVLLLKT